MPNNFEPLLKKHDYYDNYLKEIKMELDIMI